MKKFLLIVFVIFAIKLTAQDVEFRVSAPNVVSLGEQFRLIYTINDECSNFRMPELKNIEILAGPFTSTSQSYQSLNGKVTQSISSSFTYLVEATKDGKITIGPATAIVNGKKVQSNSITIDVVKGSNQRQNNQANQNNDKFDAGDLFIRVFTNKTTVYQGEPVVVTIKIYTRMQLAGFGDSKFPSYAGFYSQDIQTPTTIELEREAVNGKMYLAGLLKQTLLFPQKSGELAVEACELDVVVNEIVGESFFGPTYDRVKKKLRSTPVKITVNPLPANKPADFSGAVGTDFKMTANIDKQNVKTNEGISIKISITGNGNLKLIDALKVDVPSSFEKFDPKIDNNIRNTANGTIGSKDIEYIFIPRTAGKYRIAPITFSYFDLNTQQYRTLSTPEYNISVEKGNESDSYSTSRIKKENVETLGNDIRYINQHNFKLYKIGETFFGSFSFFLVYLILIVLFAAIVVVLRKRILEYSNISLLKTKQANKVSRKRLKTANNFMNENNKEAFYEEVTKALWGYTSDKLTIPVSQLSRDNIMETFDKYSIDKDIVDKFISVVDNCEFARYAPSAESANMENIYTDAEEVITKLEQKIKK